MPHPICIEVPMNRVEGDLEIRVELDDGVVSDAWSSGTMYRGFEKILVGRGALDGLVITPRVCGLCSTSHLTAAARALDAMAGVTVPPDAVRIRNIALAAEHVQNDLRQSFLMYTVDFVNPAYCISPLYEESVQRYAPFMGETVLEVIRESTRMLDIITIIGGQWPHSGYIVPGGVTGVPTVNDLLQCRQLLAAYRRWFERRILGCSLERLLEVRSTWDLGVWLEENRSHRDSDLGFFIRFARAIGLDRVGRGVGNYLSYGSLDLPEGTRVEGSNGQPRLVPAGFCRGTDLEAFDQRRIAEHVAHSWYEDYEGGRHPGEGITAPFACGKEGQKYSWAKAPRYDGLPAETGPLAEMVVGGDPLMVDLVGRGGPHALARQLARIIRQVRLLPAMDAWLEEATGGKRFYTPCDEIVEGEACGLLQAARGALGHWVRIADGVIEHYQIITPTAWNGSPRDSEDRRGPWEEALIGTRVRDAENPVELGHVVRSFDPCLVCTVHQVRRGRTVARARLGGFP